MDTELCVSSRWCPTSQPQSPGQLLIIYKTTIFFGRHIQTTFLLKHFSIFFQIKCSYHLKNLLFCVVTRIIPMNKTWTIPETSLLCLLIITMFSIATKTVKLLCKFQPHGYRHSLVPSFFSNQSEGLF